MLRDASDRDLADFGELPSRTDDSLASLTICVEGMRLSTVIGIDEDEADDPQPLLLDLHAGLQHARSCRTDDIGDTLNYATLRARLHRLMREHDVRLLESLANLIAEVTLEEFGAHWVRVNLRKPGKFRDVGSVGVVLLRRSAEVLRPRVCPEFCV